MKKYKILSLPLSIILVFMVFTQCEDIEQFDIANGGSLEAQVYPPSTINFIRGATESVSVEFNPFENEGKTIQDVAVYKQLLTALGNSEEVMTSSGSKESFSQTKEQLFADVPVGGETLTENDLAPGDVWNLRYEMTMADGKVLNVTTQTTIEFTCVSDLGGDYDGTTNWIDYYGVAGTDSYATNLEALGDGEYLLEDLSGGMEPIIWGNPAVEAIIKDVCGTISLVSADYLYGYEITEGWVEADGTIYIKWRNVYDENGETWLTP
jgi:hypothetical protein